MFPAPLEYYVAPALVAIAGVLLGTRRKFEGLAWCVAIALVAAIAEILWHEWPRIQPLERPRVVVAMTLALLVPAVTAFISTMLTARSALPRAGRVTVIVMAVLLALALYPLYGLLLSCYVGHECI